MNDSFFNKALESISDVEKLAKHPFYSFEPWDVEERSEEIYELARRDGVDLKDELLCKTVGDAPHPFQSGLLTDDIRIKVPLAGSQCGKTFPAVVLTIMMITGEIPIAFRYDKGEHTGFRRPITVDNIKRFGRIDKETGTVIDKDIYATRDDTWDCGEIMGAGKFPHELVCPYPNARAWIGCFSEHKHQTWIPKLRDLIPEHCLDKTKGVKGFNERDGIISLSGGREINIITYEQDYRRFESRKVWLIVLDEEPPTEKIYDAALSHCHYMVLPFTPYNGITYTKHRIFDYAPKTKNIRIYHATQYDCPFHNKEDVEDNVAGAPAWERVARIWGLHSEQSGAPYFNRSKLNYMKQYIKPVLKYGYFVPDKEVDHALDILKTSVNLVQSEKEDDWRMWEIYEEPIDGEAYLLTTDTARGAEDARDARDRSVAYIFRFTDKGKYMMDKPVMVAALRSRAEVHQFRLMCMYAARHYNNATLAPESKSESGATFVALTRQWPYYYRMTLINDESEKATSRLGFDTNQRTRTPSIDLIKTEIGEANTKDHDFRHAYLLKELSEAVKGKNGRCDHTKQGTTDCIIAYAIKCWVWKYAKHQVSCNATPKKKSKKSAWQTRIESVKSKKANGRTMPRMGYRQ